MSSTATTKKAKMPAGLYALAIGGFGIGLTEFVIMGLLPEVAKDFNVNETAAGWFITAYALGVAVGAIVITLGTLRLPRKKVLLALLILFIIGNFMSAIATSYSGMMLARIIASLNHGAFFGIGSVVAANLVPKEQAAKAIAIMFTGLTLANVLGVPFGTLLGQQFGWRSTFWVITGIGVFAFFSIWKLIPEMKSTSDVNVRTEIQAFKSPQVWVTYLVTILGFGSMFGAFTYIAFTLTGTTGFPSSAVPWLLIIVGLGLFFGNMLGGKYADKNIDKTLLAVLLGLTIVLAIFAMTAQNKILTVIMLFLMGAFGFATVPGLQSRVMNAAPYAHTLASGGNIAAFNIGNALGAWLGGVTISMGLGYTSPLWAGAALALLGFVVLLPFKGKAEKVSQEVEA